MEGNVSRIQRFINLLASRSHNYNELRKTSSIEQSISLALTTPVQMFNKNILRCKIVQGLAEAMRCTCFVETGTYHASTTIGAQRLLNIPVFSCEVNKRNYLLSRLITINMHGIVLENDDSRNFLRKMNPYLKSMSHQRPFFYFDAHDGAVLGTARNDVQVL